MERASVHRARNENGRPFGRPQFRPIGVSGLLHRAHHRADDRRQDRTAADTANHIAEQTAKGAARRRIGAGLATDEHIEYLSACNAANPTTQDLWQLSHRRILERRTDRLTADDTGNHLYDKLNKYVAFHDFPSLLWPTSLSRRHHETPNIGKVKYYERGNGI
jgi:hypothetical protein